MTTPRERALLDMGFMHDATNQNIFDSIVADLAQIRKMAAFLAEFPDGNELKVREEVAKNSLT